MRYKSKNDILLLYYSSKNYSKKRFAKIKNKTFGKNKIFTQF